MGILQPLALFLIAAVFEVMEKLEARSGIAFRL